MSYVDSMYNVRLNVFLDNGFIEMHHAKYLNIKENYLKFKWNLGSYLLREISFRGLESVPPTPLYLFMQFMSTLSSCTSEGIRSHYRW